MSIDGRSLVLVSLCSLWGSYLVHELWWREPPKPPEPLAAAAREVDDAPAAAPLANDRGDVRDVSASSRLHCLADLYAGRVAERDGAPGLELPDGDFVPYDDGLTKSAADRLDAPDLQDMFEEPYERGAHAIVTQPDFDPGRARVQKLFDAAYGATADSVNQRLVSVDILGMKVRFHERAAPALRAVAAELQRLIGTERRPEALSALGGTFNWRAVASSERRSAHSHGIALDLNPQAADYWRWTKTRAFRHPIPDRIVDAFERHDFIWGGRWYHFDTMHFEYRPELFHPNCQPARSR